jgi:allophanate hydrolase subunit 2
MLVDAVPPQQYDAGPVLRVVRGPRDDWVTDAERLVSQVWRVSTASDRVGIRLEGDSLTPDSARSELPSEGALRGAIQLPPGGEPVVFGPDHPVTGGYPVIGVVVENDTDRLAQLRPGETVGFRWV